MYVDDNIDQVIRLAILNFMLMLYDHGITEVHLGGAMRVLGVDDDISAQYDNQRVLLDEDFAKYVEQLNQPRPRDQPLH